MILWIAIAIVTLLAIALLVWPLVSTRRPFAADERNDEHRRLAVFRDRKREIERERQAGRLSDAEAAQSQADLLQQLASDLPEQATAAGSNPTPSAPFAPRLVAVVVAVLVPLIAIGVYRQVGSPQFATIDPPHADAPIDPAQIEEMIAQIEQRTREQPEDGEAWALLAQARKIQGRHAEAVPAFEKAVERLPDDAALLTEFAESAALLAGGNFSGRPVELLERALKADPSSPRAIALMGAAQYRMGNLERARVYLKQLQTFLTPGSEEAAQIASVLAQIESDLGAGGEATGIARTPAAPGGSTNPDGAVHAVAGTVVVDPSLAESASRGGTLYVVARRSGGSPVPIAALRLSGSGFPATFRLDDSNTMDPSQSLSEAKSLEIEARLSRSGDAMRQPGDLYGRLAGVRPGDRDVRVVIDQVVAP